MSWYSTFQTIEFSHENISSPASIFHNSTRDDFLWTMKNISMHTIEIWIATSQKSKRKRPYSANSCKYIYPSYYNTAYLRTFGSVLEITPEIDNQNLSSSQHKPFNSGKLLNLIKSIKPFSNFPPSIIIIIRVTLSLSIHLQQ